MKIYYKIFTQMLAMGRRAIMHELKESYFSQMKNNMRNVVILMNQLEISAL